MRSFLLRIVGVCALAAVALLSLIKISVDQKKLQKNVVVVDESSSSSLTAASNNRRQLHPFVAETVVLKCQNVFSNSNSGDYEKWVNDIEKMMECTGKKNQVFMGMSSHEYAWRFDEFIETSVPSGFPEAQLAMVSFDLQTHDYFTRHNVPSLLLSSSGKPTTMVFVKESKSKAPLLFLQKGWTLYFSEMDIFWRSPPQLNFPAKEFIVSEHNYHPEMNIGFYAVRPTANTISLFQRLLAYIEEDLVTPILNKDDALCRHDQKLMDFAVRGVTAKDIWLFSDFAVEKCCVNQNRSQCLNPFIEKLMPPQPILWEYLPYVVLPHYPLTGTISDEQLRNPQMAGIHMFGLISLEERAQWLKDNWLKGAGQIYS